MVAVVVVVRREDGRALALSCLIHTAKVTGRVRLHAGRRVEKKKEKVVMLGKKNLLAAGTVDARAIVKQKNETRRSPTPPRERAAVFLAQSLWWAS